MTKEELEKESEEYAERTKTEKEIEVLNTVHDWGQESLSPNERRLFEGIQDRERAREQGFKDGAEFGYNKANEWHYNGVPENENDILCQIDKDIFVVGYFHQKNKQYYTISGEWLKTVIAWKEIVLPKESE